jgi:hypothetical protein
LKKRFRGKRDREGMVWTAVAEVMFRNCCRSAEQIGMAALQRVLKG